MQCLDFKKASCKNCHRCLRECPVKAIAFENHQAKIIDQRCIICGTCMLVCPQNAKHVHSERESVVQLINQGARVVASIAPSFISNFKLSGFGQMQNALKKLGFFAAHETAEGALAVTQEYEKLLNTHTYKNFITSCCPSVNRLIQIHYPKALPYLAKVDTPMLAHAKLLRKKYGDDIKVVFVGPCIAKKEEAVESSLVDNVLTFEELDELFKEQNVTPSTFDDLVEDDYNPARFYPISRGIIKSFENKPAHYEYVAIDGVERCMQVLDEIDSLDGIFLELNSCEYGCVNGPCKLPMADGAVKANSDIREFVKRSLGKQTGTEPKLDFEAIHKLRTHTSLQAQEQAILEILAKTKKFKKEDELNCGMCGYSTCREKAWAVYNGYADVEMCLPYMRERAESLSYEVIANSHNAILVLDFNLNVLEINKSARDMLGIDSSDIKGQPLVDFANPTDFVLALLEKQSVKNKRIFIDKTQKYGELSITILKEHNVLFGVMKDVTDLVTVDQRLAAVKIETLATADEVIKKQMRVAQEIASLLGETTAETKVALLNLKKTLIQENGNE